MKRIPTFPLTNRGRLPLYLAFILVAASGLFLLNRADTQARDTIRKHHLEDLEQALYFTYNIHGTYPPYKQPTWCGTLNPADSDQTLNQIEAALRAQNKKYANPDKPFPRDPLAGQLSPAASGTRNSSVPDYFYWKHSPASFELYAILETNPTSERSTSRCSHLPNINYDYGITSVWRQENKT